MAYAKHETARLTELREQLAAYRHMTVDEADATGAGDRQIEAEHEIWLLEQEPYSRLATTRVA